jgi:endogenous inhibitor of DNA gyrase (YacG/DUF329 family)
MTATVTCPMCQNSFDMPEGHAGEKVPCPHCEQLVPVRKEEVMEGTRAAQAPQKGFKPCPRCGAEGARRVLFTFWGSFYGTALFNHVRCPECQYAYNGRTGRSNLIPAIIFVTIPLLIIAGLLSFIGWVVWTRLF